MRYFKLVAPLILIIVLFISCPRRPVVQPVEEVPEELPIEVPEEVPEIKIPEEPPKPELILERIFFDFDKSDIRVDAVGILERNAELLKLYPEVKITIEGHCCEVGTSEYNLALGERRANAARDYLLKLGMTPDRISTVSYGEEKPLDPSILEQNRRCEFTIQ
jgi:peptidoglycan-associated lipoprotein